LKRKQLVYGPLSTPQRARRCWAGAVALPLAMSFAIASATLHDLRHAKMAMRNAERVEDRLGLFFPILIQHLNERAGELLCVT
jgi:hypothetical protein